MQRTAEQTAILIALIFNRAGGKRARITHKTIRRVSKRSFLRRAFMERLTYYLDDLGIHMVESARGYGLIANSALEGAPVILAKNYITEELAELKTKQRSEEQDYFESLREDLEQERQEEEPEEEQ